MKKRLQLDNNDIVDISIQPGYAGDELEILRFFRIGNTIKNIRFNLWDDIAFSAYIKEETDTLEFTFDIGDPFYYCLNRFLNQDSYLVIDDDNTSFHWKKYIIIIKKGYTIKIVFKNFLPVSDYHVEEKFGVFIKHIGPDSRSKMITAKKYRIVDFLRDLEINLLEEYHQITMDEYLEYLNYCEACENVNQKIIRRD